MTIAVDWDVKNQAKQFLLNQEHGGVAIFTKLGMFPSTMFNYKKKNFLSVNNYGGSLLQQRK